MGRSHVGLVMASLLVGGVPLVAMLTAVPVAFAETGELGPLLTRVAVWALSLAGGGFLLTRPVVERWVRRDEPRSASDEAADGAQR
ncbi:hypothetical protein [Thermomonospora catenispora]|uniref:hypothetical protein n=1 Tax=Thermomonospora catenispora TaxID=2493090 RepID=UPI00112483F5|nr:hypothetical protein [Thermomonospora catenispora]TNY37269.1 hypothetical protein EIO00_09020 [Thermomonospora catenispora]